jgi:hypothetical protein
MIAVVIVSRTSEWIRHTVPVLARLTVAAAVAAAAILPLSLPYRRVAGQGLVRSLEVVGEFSATLRNYLASPSRVHFSSWSGRFFPDSMDAFFPGLVVLGLSLTATILAVRGSDRLLKRRVVMLLSIAAAGVVLSLGTRTPVYGWFYELFPPLHGIRAVARFGNLFLLGTALLAGLGAARLRASGDVRRWGASGVLALAVVNAEALRAPFEYRRFEGIPHIYSILAHEPGHVVLVEQPFYPPHAFFYNAEYVLNSTAHWRPLMNGYSGFTPDSYVRYAGEFRHFPDDRAIDAMRAAGVTHVMLHPQRFGGNGDEIQRRANEHRHLERIAVARHGLTLYRLR